MQTNEQDSSKIELTKNRLLAWISEYEIINNQMLQFINHQSQLPLLTIGSATVVIPILLSEKTEINNELIPMLLFALSIFFSGMILKYVQVTFGIHQYAIYLKDNLEPEVNRLLKNRTNPRAFIWTSNVQKRRANKIELILELSGTFGSVCLLVLPSLAAVTAGFYSLIPLKEKELEYFSAPIYIPILTWIGCGTILFYIISIFLLLIELSYLSDKAITKKIKDKE